ncbi:N-acetyltransferase [Microbispora hainanensis]|uniref:N-acetyltransferase n=1 Tax=Microbispora hainanensis TaxID=568844 RepID=A0ABZ1SR86_9ACTN|nr:MULTISPECIES: GNAT family N-acetyltransferase [Microbispora]NJP27907.1 N-acetyltransferase [Microbispora sp. CL1-1]TQS10440.1 N-acetyltransferase [Microbispora sp. SCL1-1]
MSTDVRVVDNPAASRYEIIVDGVVAGFAQYRLRDGAMVLPHTEVRGEFEGRGLGGALVGGALDAARAAGLRVVPLCSFVAWYIQRHPEYRDLVDDDYRDLVDTPG